MKKRIELADMAALLLIVLMICALFFVGLSAASALPVQDLAQYWAGSHLISSNPYSQSLYENFERSHGVVTEGLPMVMRNPPPALLLIVPLRFLNYQSAFALWDLVSIVVLTACARLAYRLVTDQVSLEPAVCSLLFGPSVALLMLGQIAIFLLLGLALFLYLIEKQRDRWAGAALALTIVKPHIVALFVVAVVMWSIRNRRWGVFFGGGFIVAMTAGVVAAINPEVFAQYLAYLAEFSKETTPYPNLGGILYVLTGRHALAYLPQIVGLAWVAFYWYRHLDDWEWKTNGMYALMVSLVCCYYSFPFDQVIVLPALMIALASGNRRMFWCGFIATNLGFVVYISGVAGHFGYGPMFLWWTALAWLITFALAQPRWPERIEAS